jgi:proline iminopeptidase
MTQLYPAIEPYEHGMLEVGDGNRVYWEACGNPRGKAAVVLHGGPGSGCTPWHRRLFNPSAYRVVLFDQRNCGRSTPHASAPDTDLASNNTASLVADIERIREHLGIERWLVLGGSWGSTLALAYAEAHPSRVTEIILFGVTTGRRKDIVEAYYRLLRDPDPAICNQAALAWCTWESASPAWPPQTGLSPRFRNPEYALAFARIVTHYVRNYAWLEDGSLLRGAGAIAEIPGIMINGRFDLQAPIGWAYDLKRVWPRSKLVIVDDAGHDASSAGITGELVRATDQFASKRE